MRAFFAFFEQHGAITLPSSDLAKHLGGDGPEVLEALRRERVVRDAPPADFHPCGALGCARAVRERPGREGRPGRFVGVCTREPAECETVDLRLDQLARVTLSRDELLRVVRRVLGVRAPQPGSVPPRGAQLAALDEPVLLGEQPRDAVVRDVFFVHRPSATPLASFLDARERAARPTLVLVPTLAGVAPDLATRHAPGAHVEVDALADLLAVRHGEIAAAPRLRVVRVAQGAAPAENDAAAPSGDGDPPAARSLIPRAERWADVWIYAIDGTMLVVRVGDRYQRVTHIDLGLAAARNRKPLRHFYVLLAVCAGGGQFRWKEFGTFQNARRLVCDLRDAMCTAFRIEDDPFEKFSYQYQWRAKFHARMGEPGEARQS